jgi:hypothetical protein
MHVVHQHQSSDKRMSLESRNSPCLLSSSLLYLALLAVSLLSSCHCSLPAKFFCTENYLGLNLFLHGTTIKILNTILHACASFCCFWCGNRLSVPPGNEFRHIACYLFLHFILVFVSGMLVCDLWHFQEQTNPISQRIVHGTTIKIIRIIFPSVILLFIAIPSFALLILNGRGIGRQWYGVRLLTRVI